MIETQMQAIEDARLIGKGYGGDVPDEPPAQTEWAYKAQPTETTTGLRLEVAWFAERMESRLRENDHKGGWEESSKGYLLNSLDDEFMESELRAALHSLSDADTEAIVAEAIDIANFAIAVVADNARRKEDLGNEVPCNRGY